jgi:FAD binding domain/Berberine and berberine like
MKRGTSISCLIAIALVVSTTGCRADILRLNSSDTKFADAVRPWNKYYEGVMPSSVQYCSDEQDVIDAIAYARDNHIKASVRGAGHSFAALSIAERQTVIDVSLIKDLSFSADGAFAYVGAGVTFKELNDALELGFNRFLPGVTCDGVSMGAALSGGYGFMHRRYGLMTDNLVDVRIVLYNGTAVDTEDGVDDLLRWAMKGAGAGSYGVVTRYKMRTHLIPQGMIDFSMRWDLEMHQKDLFLNIMDTFEPWTRELPDNFTARISMYVRSGNRVKVSINGLALNMSACEARNLSEPMIDIRDHSDASFVSSVWQEQSSVPDDGSSRQMHIAASLLGTDLGADGTNECWSILEDAKSNGRHLRFTVNPFGGAMARVSPHESSFPLRDAHAWMINIQAQGSDEERVSALSTLSDYRDRMWQFSSGAAYRNYASVVERENYMSAYFSDENVAQLVAIKRRYDPLDIFSHARSVPLH